MSRAISAFKPCLDISDMEQYSSIGLNPGHDAKINTIQDMNRKQKYKLSKILKDITKNRNFGINVARRLFPTKKSNKNKQEKQKSQKGSAHITNPKISRSSIDNSHLNGTLPWVD